MPQRQHLHIFLPRRRSRNGRAGAGNRTPDLLLTMEALCRLSYPGGREMITMRPSQPRMTCHDVPMRRPLIACVVALSLVSCAKDEPTVDAVPVTSAVIQTDDGTTRLTVEAADTDSEREHGLMDRTSLGADDGMVFLFDAASSGSFWMKDTLIPLSIAFWDEDGQDRGHPGHGPVHGRSMSHLRVSGAVRRSARGEPRVLRGTRGGDR